MVTLIAWRKFFAVVDKLVTYDRYRFPSVFHRRVRRKYVSAVLFCYLKSAVWLVVKSACVACRRLVRPTILMEKWLICGMVGFRWAVAYWSLNLLWSMNQLSAAMLGFFLNRPCFSEVKLRLFPLSLKSQSILGTKCIWSSGRIHPQWTWYQARLPAELKHINKRRKRN